MAKISTKAEFQKASNLMFVRDSAQGGRTSDQRILRVDALLDEYQEIAAPGTQASIVKLTVLYYALEIWLKAVDRKDTSTHADRKKSVDALYRQVVAELSLQSKVPVNLLPGWLAATFGKGMVEHGVTTDLTNASAKYMDKSERDKFRLQFRNGLVYQQQWWRGSEELVLAHSVSFQPVPDKPHAPTEITRGYSGYVLSLGGDFYTNKHQGGSKGKGLFHSTYFSGEAILCAGEICLEEGVVKAINTSSGHYRPSKESMTMALQVLACLGAFRPEIQVKVFDKDASTAKRYLDLEANILPLAKVDHDRHLTAHHLKGSLPDRGHEAKMSAAVEVIKIHWSTKPEGHGYLGRDKCAECKKFELLWKQLEDLVRTCGGVKKAVFVPRPTSNQGIAGFSTRPVSIHHSIESTHGHHRIT